jgi:Fe-S-cluster containining protein
LEEKLAFEINWNLPEEEFRRRVDELIARCEAEGKVVALDIAIGSGRSFLDALTLLLTQVNCEGCDAPCCQSNPNDLPMQLGPNEAARLRRYFKDGRQFDFSGDWPTVSMPCPFFEEGRCMIYDERPMVCVFYPFNPGATDEQGSPVLAMESRCPEARRIVQRAYMMEWKLRQAYKNF